MFRKRAQTKSATCCFQLACLDYLFPVFWSLAGLLCRTASPKTCHRRCARGFNWGTLPNECWDLLPGLAYSCLTSSNGSLLPLTSFQTDLKAQGRLEKEEKPSAADIEQSAPCLQDVLLCCCQPAPMPCCDTSWRLLGRLLFPSSGFFRPLAPEATDALYIKIAITSKKPKHSAA